MFGRGKNVVASVSLYLISVDTLCAEIVSNFAIISFFVPKTPTWNSDAPYLRTEAPRNASKTKFNIFFKLQDQHTRLLTDNKIFGSKFKTIFNSWTMRISFYCTVSRAPYIILQHNGELDFYLHPLIFSRKKNNGFKQKYVLSVNDFSILWSFLSIKSNLVIDSWTDRVMVFVKPSRNFYMIFGYVS